MLEERSDSHARAGSDRRAGEGDLADASGDLRRDRRGDRDLARLGNDHLRARSLLELVHGSDLSLGNSQTNARAAAFSQGTVTPRKDCAKPPRPAALGNARCDPARPNGSVPRTRMRLRTRPRWE